MTIESTSSLVLPPPVVVFVRPQAAGNIGALARVMSNFGLTELRLVGDDPSSRDDLPAALGEAFRTIEWALAKKGEAILRSAQWSPTLADALTGLDLAIGTSGRAVEFELGYARPLVAPEAAFATVSEWTNRHGGLRWALVFGAEDDGLFDAEAALCQQLVRISTHEMNPSMNIAMAAAVLFYHWQLCRDGRAPLGNPTPAGAFVEAARATRASEPARDEFASLEHKEAFLEYLMTTVERTSFFKYPDHGGARARVRRWLQAGLVPLGELLYAFEILYHLRAWGSGSFEKRDFLKIKGTGSTEGSSS